VRTGGACMGRQGGAVSRGARDGAEMDGGGIAGLVIGIVAAVAVVYILNNSIWLVRERVRAGRGAGARRRGGGVRMARRDSALRFACGAQEAIVVEKCGRFDSVRGPGMTCICFPIWAAKVRGGARRCARAGRGRGGRAGRAWRACEAWDAPGGRARLGMGAGLRRRGRSFSGCSAAPRPGVRCDSWLMRVPR
jgi:hypothetical protein